MIFFLEGNSLYKNFFNMKKLDLDSRKHLLYFSPMAPFAVQDFFG